MNTIWKWQLATSPTAVQVPAGARFLTAQYQRNHPCVWALVDDTAPMEQRVFSIYGTGHQMPKDPGTYVGTFQMLGGDLVFHVFVK